MMEEGNIAVYLDFENLALGAEETYPSQMKPLKMAPIIDYLTTKGNICVRKAYADWSNSAFSGYQRDLIEVGFEMIHLPGTSARGKAGADVKLAVDAIEMLDSFESLDIFVIGSGDTDFIPLIQRLRARGKNVIVIGFEHSVGTLVQRNCTEYKCLEEILGEHEKEAVSVDVGHETGMEDARQLMLRYTNTSFPEGPVAMSRLKLDLLRLDPSFSERRYGYRSFKEFVESFVGDIIERIEPDPTTGLPQIVLREAEPLVVVDKSVVETATQFLRMNLKFPSCLSDADTMSATLLDTLDDHEFLSMKEMASHIYENSNDIRKATIRKFVNTLFTGDAFAEEVVGSYVPLASRRFKLKERIQSSDMIRETYLDRVTEIVDRKFPELEGEDIENMTHLK
ncbi:MAG: NYN domain-containing protein [Thermoplasmata archaeon]|nr:NYN domain-containing protein [Thermoplasmata archaeon]